MRTINRTLSVWIAVFLGLALGCSNPPADSHEAAEPLVQLLTAYVEATHKLERPPQNDAELRQFLPDGEKWLVSPRDGQHYVIRWGVSVHDPNLDPANPPLIAYEQTGKDGIRHAINVMGLAELTDEQFASLKMP